MVGSLWGKPDSNRQPNVHDVALTNEGLPSYSYFPEYPDNCSLFENQRAVTDGWREYKTCVIKCIALDAGFQNCTTCLTILVHL